MTFYSPTLEILAQTLCQQVKKRTNPFETIHIWVPHEGMASWLRHTIATELGMAAQLQFSQPRTALWQMAQQLFPQRRLKLSQVELLLTLQHQLSQWVNSHAELNIFAHYLKDQEHYALSLASACAQTFEDYLTYRPDWILQFSQHQPGTLALPAALDQRHQDLWLAQHKLWHLLETAVDPEGQRWHRAQLQAAVKERLGQGSLETLPARWPGQGSIPLQIFALIEEAPFYTQMLKDLPRHIQVQHYTLDESAVSQAGSFGYSYWHDNPPPHDTAPAPASVPLHIQVEGCHNALREVEVLQDLIKKQARPASRVGVMLWDLEHYRPLIHGVFREQRLPYTLMQNPQDSLLAQSFDTLIETHQGRLQREDVMALLENEWIAQAFGFYAFSASELRRTLDQVDIRWGRNDFHRQQLGLPAFGQNSWEAGIKRLLLTYALPDQGGYPYKSHLPEGHEMPRLDILRAVLRFFDAVQRYLNPLFKPHTLPQWSAILHQILHSFFGAADSEQLLPLREAVGRLPDLLKQLNADPEDAPRLFSLNEAQALLKLCWSRKDLPTLHHGRILLGTPEQLAGIPFDDIYMLGLNLGSVPSKQTPNDLDLRLQSPAEPGEIRAKTRDFRLFLRCMQGARKRWVLIYQSRHMRHKNDLAPAGILDALIHHYALEVTHHPLQAFAVKYFQKDTGYTSYDPMYRECAQMIEDPSKAQELIPFRKTPLTLPAEDTPEVLSTQGLQRFFKAPARHFLQQRLGIYYARPEETQEPHERFELNALEKYLLKKEALQRYVHYQGDLASFRQRMLSSGKLPVGEAGAWHLEQALEDLLPFYAVLKHLFEATAVHQLHTWQGALSLNGQFLAYTALEHAGLPPESALYLQWRPGGLKAKPALDLWIDHLFLSAVSSPEQPIFTCMLAKDDKKTPCVFFFRPLSQSEAEQHLNHLLADYQQGQQTPLAFAPETSRAFALDFAKNRDLYSAVKAARKTWEPDSYQPEGREGSDPGFAHCLEEEWFMAADAQALAQQIWDPLEEHLQQIPLQVLNPEHPFAILIHSSHQEPLHA